MKLRLLFAVPALVLAFSLADLRAADDENPIVTTVKSKVKDKDKPFGMAVMFKVKSGSEKDFETAFAPCVKATRKEPGCITYHFNRDLDDGSTYVVYEQFRSIAALEEHAKSKHVEELVKKIGPMLDGEPKVKVFTIVAGE
jgi:quinol monooxygenase YgiN